MRRSLLILLLSTAALAARLPLRSDWMIQSSGGVREPGAVLSTAAFRPDGWYQTTLPSTVVSALVQNRSYADPYFGMNLRSIGGTTYPIGLNFSNTPMPPESPFGRAWWYR